jgi:hypothetical protein
MAYVDMYVTSWLLYIMFHDYTWVYNLDIGLEVTLCVLITTKPVGKL